MSTVHTYTIHGVWNGTANTSGSLESHSLHTAFSIPANLGGPGEGTNPEELLLGAAAGCYLITLSKLLVRRSVSYRRIDLTSEGIVVNDRGLRFDEIIHRPTIVVGPDEDMTNVAMLAEHAEHACMVSSALRGNVGVRVEPNVVCESEPSFT